MDKQENICHSARNYIRRDLTSFLIRYSNFLLHFR